MTLHESSSIEGGSPRVLVIAVACSPAKGSEAGVGWNRAVQTARFFPTWVVTEEGKSRDEINEYLRENGPIKNLHFVWVSNGIVGAFLRKFRWTYYLSYHLWHRRVFREIQTLHRQHDFDLVHQLTYCGFREPGLSWKLPIPFVWGPIGGTQNFPWRFLTSIDVRGALSEFTRSVINQVQLLFSRSPRLAIRRSAALLAANSSVQSDCSKYFGIEPEVRIEIGTTKVEACGRPLRDLNQPFRMLWSGELRTRKALPLLLHAIQRIKDKSRVEVRVLGQGPCEARWKRIANKLGIAEQVRFLGFLPHATTVAQLQWADAFVFTSLRDTTGTVVLEALSQGLPIICLNHQGTRDLIDESNGIKVDVTTPEQVITNLANAITQLSESPEKCEELSRGAIERAREFTWDRQGEHMANVYRRVIGEHSHNKPIRDASETNLGVGDPQTKARVLMFAYSCHPTFSMESRVGWNRAIESAKQFDTVVLYGDAFELTELQSFASRLPQSDRLQFVRVEHSRWGKKLITKPGCFYWAYHGWHRRAYKHAIEMHRMNPFQLVHQVNFCGFREPGYGWKIGPPFVWGPVGGTQNFPTRFLTMTDPMGCTWEVFRTIANEIQLRWSSRVRRAARASSQVFAANSATQREFKRLLNLDSKLQLEIGVERIADSNKTPRDSDKPIRLLWAGRLRTWKGLPILFHALAQLPSHFEFELRVMGEGSSLNRWKRLAKQLKIDQRITWLMWPPYEVGLENYRWADIFMFTSLRDTSGTGLLDALAAGTPVIGLNHQGAADIVTKDSGVLVDVHEPKQVVAAFSEAIMRLASDSNELHRLSCGARDRALEYRWSRLSEVMRETYNRILTSKVK